MIVFPSRKCKSKALPIDFPFISSQDTKFEGTKDSRELPSQLQTQSKFIKVRFPSLDNFSSRRQFTLGLSSLQWPPPTPTFSPLQYWHANHAVLTSFLFSQFFWNILFSTVNSFGGVPHWGSTVYSVNHVSARSPHPALPSPECLLVEEFML